jgi:hypothetical protein
MRTVWIALFLTATLAGCVSSRLLTLPDGRQGFAIKCNGHLHDMGDCYAKAGEMCPTGYTVLDGNTETSPVGFGGSYANANRYGASAGSSSYVGAMVFRSMIVECKSPFANR